MFYQNESPEVVRKVNGMEFHRNKFCRESKEESSVKVSLLGYKVMEEKTKFTLKELFPVSNFSLPSKRWFNNFSTEFLEERRLGLQDFLQNLVANKDVLNSEAVREFLCLDEPHSGLDSLEKRAFCETDCHLQRTLMDNKCEIESPRSLLVHKELQISTPERIMM
ncbi:Sorting nexin-16 [Triplophysa tibetana]|uniref:Sorting nexin-16 n=1 Tax=Triplophysa tibetana TaxID=1572043 RepID=A0A5A9PDJ7_9TELE|nr:Sorting nexin-16 [Triplophysa tibetana]